MLATVVLFSIATSVKAQIVLDNPLGIDSFEGLIGVILAAVVPLITSFAVLMFIYAGGLFIFSAGRPNVVQKAKDALQYAIVGAVIALAAQVLVDIIGEVLGAS